MITVPCAVCGAPVHREPSKLGQHAFCGPEHWSAWRKAENLVARQQRRAAAAQPDAAKPCPACGEVKPLTAYSVDRSRSDGHMRTCKACNDAKSRAYYEQHQDRLRERARERKRAARQKP